MFKILVCQLQLYRLLAPNLPFIVLPVMTGHLSLASWHHLSFVSGRAGRTLEEAGALLPGSTALFWQLLQHVGHPWYSSHWVLVAPPLWAAYTSAPEGSVPVTAPRWALVPSSGPRPCPLQGLDHSSGLKGPEGEGGPSSRCVPSLVLWGCSTSAPEAVVASWACHSCILTSFLCCLAGNPLLQLIAVYVKLSRFKLLCGFGLLIGLCYASSPVKTSCN